MGLYCMRLMMDGVDQVLVWLGYVLALLLMLQVAAHRVVQGSNFSLGPLWARQEKGLDSEHFGSDFVGQVASDYPGSIGLGDGCSKSEHSNFAIVTSECNMVVTNNVGHKMPGMAVGTDMFHPAGQAKIPSIICLYV